MGRGVPHRVPAEVASIRSPGPLRSQAAEAVGARGEAQGFPERAAAGLNSGSFRYLAKAGKIEGVQGYAGCGAGVWTRI